MLNGLASFCADSPGLVAVEYVPTAWVDRENYRYIRSEANEMQVNVPLLQGSWLSIRFLPGQRLWQETATYANGLPFFQQRLSGTTPAMRPASTLELANTMHYQFLLRVKDRKGQWWLLGTPDNPFTFSYNAASSGSGYQVEFSADTETPAIGLNI